MVSDFLKKTGLHHGRWSLLLIIIFHIMDPLVGWSVAIGTGFYFIGREVSQSQYRKWSNNPIVILKNIEIWDFLTPCIISLLYLIYNWFTFMKDILP